MQINRVNNIGFGSVIPLKGESQNVEKFDEILYKRSRNENYGIVEIQDNSTLDHTSYDDYTTNHSKVSPQLYFALVTGKDWSGYVTDKVSTHQLCEKAQENEPIDVDYPSMDDMQRAFDAIEEASSNKYNDRSY